MAEGEKEKKRRKEGKRRDIKRKFKKRERNTEHAKQCGR